MKVQVLEFFAVEQNDSKGLLNGTLKVKLTDFGIIIMGILASKRKNVYFFTLPGHFCNSHLTGQKIRYPYIVFEDPEQQRALINSIREAGISFIEALIADPKRSLSFQPSKEAPSIAAKPLNTADENNPTENQEEQKNSLCSKVLTKSQLIKPSKLAILEYEDLPPRKTFIRNSKLGRR